MRNLTEQQKRARMTGELEAAARALRHANALFEVLRIIAAARDARDERSATYCLDDVSLMEIGAELTSTYAERAETETECAKGDEWAT
jgi:hypothetical protein